MSPGRTILESLVAPHALLELTRWDRLPSTPCLPATPLSALATSITAASCVSGPLTPSGVQLSVVPRLQPQSNGVQASSERGAGGPRGPPFPNRTWVNPNLHANTRATPRPTPTPTRQAQLSATAASSNNPATSFSTQHGSRPSRGSGALS